MRKIIFAVVALALTGLYASVSQGQNRTLVLYNWSEYIDPQIIKDFETKFQVKVQQAFYESDDDMFAKLQLSGTNQYDLVVPSTALGAVMVNITATP